MQEIFSEDERPFESVRKDNLADELATAYAVYSRMRGRPLDYRPSLEMFKTASTYCRTKKVRPEFFMHAVFNYSVDSVPSVISVSSSDSLTKYEFWESRIPAELADKELASPFSVDVHAELETMVQMILTKCGHLDFDNIRFKIACADPIWDVSPVTRIILSDASDLVLKYYGQDYLLWVMDNKWKKLVLLDFDMSHEEIERRVKNG